MSAGHLFTLFSDFNCPFCYALHERLHELQLIGRCAWQGVQHAPYLPVPLKPWLGSLSAELRHEVSVVRRLSPDLPLEVPVGKPNTALAIACVAEKLRQDPEAGLMMIRRMYQACWVEGRDISDPQLLVELRGSQPHHISSNASDVARAWMADWEATGQAGVPLILGPNDDVLLGCVPTEEIQKFFADHS